MSDVLYMIVPCYNEEEVLPITIPQFVEALGSLIGDKLIDGGSKIVFVNDGSSDATWEIIKESARSDPHIEGIDLAGNVGHQNALIAGMEYAKEHCDMCISIDADLQDDVNAVKSMIEKYRGG